MAASEGPILDAAGISAALDRLAASVLAAGEGRPPCVIGIRRRGVPLAERLCARIAAQSGQAPASGALDITLYRDDLTMVADQPLVAATEIDFPVDGTRIVLVDDVLYTGRTIRSAIDALFALGRPARIELCVLADRRGLRELPIQADHAALTLETTREQSVEVSVEEIDGRDGVEVVRRQGGSA